MKSYFLLPTLLLSPTLALPQPPSATPPTNPLFPHGHSSAHLFTRETSAHQSANIQITTYSSTDCKAGALGTSNIANDQQYPVSTTGQVIKSVYLTRALGGGEQLDFSVYPVSIQGSIGAKGKRDGAPVACGLWLFSVGAGTQEGCLKLQKTASCFELWKH